MKKSISMLLAVVMLCSFCMISASAANTPTFEIASVKADPGKSVDVTVSFKNSPGIQSANHKVSFGDELTLTAVKYNDALGGSALTSKELTSPVTLSWYNIDGLVVGDVVFATLTFTVSENAAAGSKIAISLTYDPDSVYDKNEDNVYFAVQPGGVTINSKACTHTNKTEVAEKASTCLAQGWDKYYECDDCGQLFDAKGEEIESVPFRALGSHTGGTASCEALAVCTVCKQSYGEYGAHNFTDKTKSAKTMKTAATCKVNAEYYYSCAVCGVCENNDNHTFSGGKAAHNYVDGKCTVCGADDPDYNPGGDDSGGFFSRLISFFKSLFSWLPFC